MAASLGPGKSNNAATQPATGTTSEFRANREASSAAKAAPDLYSASPDRPRALLPEADREIAEAVAPISGCLLLEWLATHFSCRLFADTGRTLCLLPQQLLEVHPSPVVALLERQQEHFSRGKAPAQVTLAQNEQQQQQHPQVSPSARSLQCSSAHDMAHKDAISTSSGSYIPEIHTCCGEGTMPPHRGNSSSGGVDVRRLCQRMRGVRGAAWVCAAKEMEEKLRDTLGPCTLDAFACPFAFAISETGTCNIFPLPQEPDQQQSMKNSSFQVCPPVGFLQLCQQGGDQGSLSELQTLLKEALLDPAWRCRPCRPDGLSEAAFRELFFYLWGPADACMAADVAACHIVQWRLSFNFCSSCPTGRFRVYEHILDFATSNSSGDSTSTSNNSANTHISSASQNSAEGEKTLSATSAACRCCCLRCCCIQMPQSVLEAVARDDLRLAPQCKNGISSNSRGKRGLPDRLLQFTEDWRNSEPSSDGESWLSELPSSPSSSADSPRMSPRADAADAEALEGIHGLPAAAEALPVPGLRTEGEKKSSDTQQKGGKACDERRGGGLSDDAVNNAVAALQQCLSVCIPMAGSRVTPLLNNSTLDDAGWIVAGAHNVNASQITAQAASVRSFLAFACTESWEVLLLLHASAAASRALSDPLQGCADVCSVLGVSLANGNVVRRLSARPEGVYEQLMRKEESSQKEELDFLLSPLEKSHAYIKIPHCLTLVEAYELQKGREFRVFAAGRLPVGISQLWLAECVPELVNSASLRRRTRRAVWQFFLRTLSRQPLPPLFVADVYIHRNADGTESCRLLRLNPWGFQTDPLLFTFDELRTSVLRRCCTSIQLCNSCTSLLSSREVASPGAPPPGRCNCWELCELRYIRGTDEEIYDSQRSLAMPQDFLDIARGGGNSNVEEILLDLKAAHLDVIKKHNRRKQRAFTHCQATAGRGFNEPGRGLSHAYLNQGGIFSKARKAGRLVYDACRNLLLASKSELRDGAARARDCLQTVAQQGYHSVSFKTAAPSRIPRYTRNGFSAAKLHYRLYFEASIPRMHKSRDTTHLKGTANGKSVQTLRSKPIYETNENNGELRTLPVMHQRRGHAPISPVHWAGDTPQHQVTSAAI
ncbi:uncharacterized protein LOC34619916 [Cyclospora cayetanensis]|uniref:Uncharacterized protein LOC34619916 n=1 Tax=Cyclospora cayetanensis TaxID=88456 RepID=A0A6P6RST5_9EIME|nr:uncharacterized protein LOC34619916 [Cyclospora cayetanensis]